jgi:hypothetical protein
MRLRPIFIAISGVGGQIVQQQEKKAWSTLFTPIQRISTCYPVNNKSSARKRTLKGFALGWLYS